MRRSDGRRLTALEAAYRETLVSALTECAQGRWGLFGHNDEAWASCAPQLRARLRSAQLDELLELGAQIAALRKRLGEFEPFALHEQLLQMRDMQHANSPGEPKLAEQWLAELNAEMDVI